MEPGTQSGKILRLRGKGLPSVNSYEGRGDLLVSLIVWTPKNLSKEERAILSKLGDSGNFKPSAADKEKGFFHRMRNYFE